MKKKVLVILFFIVVFGFPVSWYLFLQAFGENQFALPKIEQWDDQCFEVSTPTLLIQAGSFDEFPNQWKRIQTRMDQQALISVQEVEGCEIIFDMYLVDETGWVRGQFETSRKETDRLLAEIDILILNHHESDRK